jgi:thiol-disulfide isomerase/thioredoxin
MRRWWYGLGAAVLAVGVAVAVTLAGRTAATRLASGAGLVNGPAAPALDAAGWLNSRPLTRADLAGKVVLYDFWTYSCVNCVRTLPYLTSWYQRYAGDGLVVVGIHSPEFDFEKVHANVAAAVTRLDVSWPVALDDQMNIWNAFGNQYWPADYITDRAGRIRHTHFGEGDYPGTEDILRRLLAVDPRSPRASTPSPTPASTGVATDQAARVPITPETYLGTDKGVAGARSGPATYPDPGDVATNQVRLSGRWVGETDDVRSTASGAAVVLAYRAREVNLVLASAMGGVDLRVELDGHPLPPTYRTGQTRVDAQGATFVSVAASDLYRLVLGPAVQDHTLRLTATGAGVEMFAFTFG